MHLLSVPLAYSNLLQAADAAQQSFSSDTQPALHRALPALETLHASWTMCLGMPEFSGFSTALRAGLDTIEEYYDKTSVSDIYTMSMCEYSDVYNVFIDMLTLDTSSTRSFPEGCLSTGQLGS